MQFFECRKNKSRDELGKENGAIGERGAVCFDNFNCKGSLLCVKGYCD